MTWSRLFGATTVLMCALFGVGLAQLASQQASHNGPANDVVDRFQRTHEVLQNNEVATSGVGRGETIYFYKCWMCHNNGARNGDTSGLVGPSLKNVATRLKADEALTAKIGAGGPRMPAFRHTFTDADVADLVSYLKSPTCCYENDEPPKNPHYNADTTPWPVSTTLKGGVRGLIRLKNGRTLEGVKVQLIAPNNVRTTVFTNGEGRYEFPTLQAGSYTLRVPTPIPFKAYAREGVSIKGAMTLEDIVLELLPSAEPVMLRGGLAPTHEVMSQLSGAE